MKSGRKGQCAGWEGELIKSEDKQGNHQRLFIVDQHAGGLAQLMPTDQPLEVAQLTTIKALIFGTTTSFEVMCPSKSLHNASLRRVTEKVRRFCAV
jgi:hypothetical protein